LQHRPRRPTGDQQSAATAGRTVAAYPIELELGSSSPSDLEFEFEFDSGIPGIPMRDLILDAAERLLARFGYRKMTMEDLAREAGIGKGTIYLSFPSKEEVALCSIDRVVQRVQQQLQTLAASGGPAAD